MIHKIDINSVSLPALEALFNSTLQKDFAVSEEVSLADYAAKSFLIYGASVIAGRAFPSVFDGLKHGQRRLLYTMKDELKLSDNGHYLKSARVVGSAIGMYHPHGDTAMYETLVTQTKPWVQMIPFANGQGNWGSIDGSDAAAPRYTETRLTQASNMLFSDIKFNTVDFIPNYDGREIEPVLLPAPFPNILINGILPGSIAVGMSSASMPHNPTEVMNAMIANLEHRKNGESKMTIQEFLSYVPGPDFPTGGFLYKTEKMDSIVESGNGTIRIRAKHHIEENKRNSKIIITEIPWLKNKMSLISEVENLKLAADKSDRLAQAITRVNDETDKHNPLRIAITVKNNVDPELVWNYILQKTGFDDSYSYFVKVLDSTVNSEGKSVSEPREYGLLQVLDRYIDFRVEYFERKNVFLIESYNKRLHIIEGILSAMSEIDIIIALIKASKSTDDAKVQLVSKGYSTIQAESIIAMRLGRLSRLSTEEIETEMKKLLELKDYSNKILTNREFKYTELISETKVVANKIGKERKTIIKPELSGVNLEDIIPKEDCVIYITNKGYVKRVSKKDIEKQNRGTQGKKGIKLTDGDFVEKIFNTNTHSIIMFIMSSGQVYGTKAYNIPDSQRGSFVDNIFETNENDKIVNVVEIEEFNKKIILVTKNGQIKASMLDTYTGALRRSGVKGINLKDDDIVVSAKVVDIEAEEEIVIATRIAKTIRFNISDISVTGRATAGVRGIRLKEGNYVIGSSILKEGTIIATITDGGMVKLSEEKEFKIQSRGGLGVTSMELTNKSGQLNSIVSWLKVEEMDLVTITSSGVLNRINTESIRKTSRKTKGVKLVDLRENDKLVSVLKAEKEEAEDN